jgi:protein-S-isoprenylcysteine O-methyltransferase Ste14
MFHEWRGGNSFKTIIVFLLAAGFVFKTATPAHAAAIGTPAASQAPAGFLQGSLPGLSNPLYLFNLAAFGLVLLGSLAMRREGGIRYLGAGMIVLGLFSLVFTIATLTIGAGSWYLFLAAGIFFGGLVVVAMGWISQKRSEGAVATSWPYSGLRHPIYLGHIVWSFGLGMWQTSYLTGSTGILPIAVGIIMAVFMWRATVARVQSEEAYLLRSHGRDYVAYSRDTPRGIEGRPPRLKFIVVVLLIIIGIVTLFWGLSAGWNLLQAIAVSSGTGGLLQMGMIAFVGGNTPRNSPLALSDGLDESALRALMRKAEELNEREHAVDRKAALMDELLRGSDLKLGLVDGSVDRTVEHMAAILGEGSVVVPVAAETPNLYGLVAAVARRYQAAQGASVVLAVQTFAMKERADDLILARGYANVKTILAPDAFRERAAIGGQKRYTFDVGLAKTNLLRLVSPFGLKVLRTANVDVVNEQAIRGAIVMAIDEWLKQVALSPADWDALRAIAEAIQRSA